MTRYYISYECMHMFVTFHTYYLAGLQVLIKQVLGSQEVITHPIHQLHLFIYCFETKDRIHCREEREQKEGEPRGQLDTSKLTQNDDKVLFYFWKQHQTRLTTWLVDSAL